MKTYIRRQQHKKSFIHQDIKQKEPPQKYRLGTISYFHHISYFKHAGTTGHTAYSMNVM